ncbi:hypothetical protein CC85DRAFT_249776 [Cutaneotrichosporon oleaginosum]|uniref:Glycosyl transferase CAP10 domain-containing protein n=1 Tax=Cutaneotrichosporon oleaginosum TaxID=879819 RepID=A0A0J1AY37_9TREE|nr:uncharacterized protein CC85DRAFT_249776 [Cutaneotrichosporon oleaginosum]KLT40244.1 hypothetical protein CC85DRAFT_249776 [Cutaneotrichosporon oleaginosum]TXT11306.1 hypothetical protein COLE_01716 [Cutaneotrichosporon oleaginosum]
MGRSATPLARAARLTEAAHAPRRVPRAPLPDEVRGAAHTVSGGMLHVDPDSPVHPIYQLIRDARAAWDAKFARQSTTLRQATDEYVRRYRRAPPIGFDKWWHYVVDNRVQLPDEYDQIDRDLHLFHALHPNDIIGRVAKAAREPDTFVLKVRRGLVRTTGSVNSSDWLHGARRDGQLELIRPIARHLPDLTAVYTVHDTPFNFVSHAHKAELLDHIEDDEYLDRDDLPDVTLRGWAQACSRASPLRTYDADAELPEPSHATADKTFIVDHKASMNPCTHPELVRLHGFLSGKVPVAQELSAKFAISKTFLHADVLGIPPEMVAHKDNVTLVPWERKVHERLLWRGANTGMYYSSDLAWRDSHRVRLVQLADEAEGRASVLSPPGLMRGRSVGAATQEQDVGSANTARFDMAFVDAPIQCDDGDGTCAEIAAEYPYRQRVSREEADAHKYVVDVDGNAWSARFQRLLMSGSLVFKSTIMPEWYNDRIQPWVHYVPVKLDYSDLRDALAFFAGDEHGEGGRDDLAENIGMAGREWAETFYRKQDMIAYVFRLYLEWARLQAPNRRAMAFKYDPAMEAVRT